jgi:hypothetical protein
LEKIISIKVYFGSAKNVPENDIKRTPSENVDVEMFLKYGVLFPDNGSCLRFASNVHLSAWLNVPCFTLGNMS